MSDANPFTITTPEGMSSNEAVKLFVDVLSDLPQVERQGHVFLLGARGTGKSMAFRFLMPDCQCLHQHISLDQLRFFAIYIPIKLTDLKLAELMKIDGKHASAVLNEHFMASFIAERLGGCLFDIASDPALYQWQEKEPENLPATKAFLADTFNELLLDCGEDELAASDIAAADCTRDCWELLWRKCRRMRSRFTTYVRQLSGIGEIKPYRGGLCSYLDFLHPLIDGLMTLPFMPVGRPAFLLIDDADNLSLEQTRVLNSWVNCRTTRTVSIKVSSQFNYKTYYTPDGFTIEAPHDFSEVNISTIYTNKGNYRKRVEQIIARRLDLAGLGDITPKMFFPFDQAQEDAISKIAEEKRLSFKRTGRGYRASDDVARYARPDYMRQLRGMSKSGPTYSYAGFEQLVHISSGI